jgi:hypothetical protein
MAERLSNENERFLSEIPTYPNNKPDYSVVLGYVQYWDGENGKSLLGYYWS